jgi:hypothetical protein
MMADDTGNLRFRPIGDVFFQDERLQFVPSPNVSFPEGFVQVTTLYDVGFLFTDSNSQIRALKPRTDTLRLSLLSLDQNHVVASFNSFQDGLSQLSIRRDDIVPGYNCHGFTFAGSKYWMDDDQIETVLAGESYRETNQNDAQILIFRRNNKIVHSALVDHVHGCFHTKAGVRGFSATRSIADAAQGNDFDAYFFFKKVPTRSVGSLNA